MTKLPKGTPWYDAGAKRTLDFLFAALAFIVLLPLMLLIVVLLLIFQPGWPIFRQKRVGFRCCHFYIYKFRTMTEERGEDGELLPDEARTTLIGSVLRATSLDELPELINILRGDMSLIGPRPWVPEQMSTFSERTQRRRMSVRPGLSGFAQILGRNNISLRQRICLDLRYIRHRSPALDTIIFFLTIYKVLKREGIYASPAAVRRSPLGAAPKDPTTKGRRANQLQRSTD